MDLILAPNDAEIHPCDKSNENIMRLFPFKFKRGGKGGGIKRYGSIKRGGALQGLWDKITSCTPLGALMFYWENS